MHRNTLHALCGLAAGLLLALAGCGKPAASGGSVRVSVSLHQALSPDISRVTVTLTAADLAARSTDLAPGSDGHWSGNLADIPAGSGRTFTAEALDSSGTRRFVGQVSGITISANETAAVALVLQEVGGPGPLDNAVPAIDAVLASVDRIVPGGSVSLEVRAHDSDAQDSLTYAWTASDGAFASASSAATAWTAPQSAGRVTVTVTVTDSRGASATLSLPLDVGIFPPVIATTSQGALTSYGVVDLYVAAWDPQQAGDLSFSWSTNWGSVGGFGRHTSSSGSWRPPACLPSGAVPVVTVVVRNVAGLTTPVTFTITDSIPTCSPGGWSPALSMSTARTLHTATLLPSGQVLVAGGLTSSYGTASAELFDPATGAWSAPPEMLARRQRHTATLLSSGQVLVTGGQTATGTVATAEQYDPAANTWTAAGAMSSVRSSHRAVQLPSGKVLVVGGIDNNYTMLATAELYDPATDTWAPTGALSTPRANATLTLLPSGKVLVTGGQSTYSTYLASAELYDPATGTWTAAGTMSTVRALHAATLLPSGKVLVTGGATTYYTYNSPQLASAELYDPATGTWTPTGAMTTGRSGHVLAALNSGKVLVAGGRDTSGSVATSELYDPASGTWSAVPTNMSRTRLEATATVLPSGKVLVAGGRLLAYAAPRNIEVSFPTETVELYVP